MARTNVRNSARDNYQQRNSYSYNNGYYENRNDYENADYEEYDEDDDNNDEYEEDDEVTDEDVDNSDMSFSGRNICIRLNYDNDKTERLEKSVDNLFKKYPKLNEIEGDNKLQKMQQILDGMFPEGFAKKMYIRNLTFTGRSGYDTRRLGIRPERNPNDFMEKYLPDDVTLVFKGYVAGKEFIVESVYDVMDTERLDYEVDATATPYSNAGRINENFLYDILDDAGSITEYTGDRLDEWREYLDWKRELASRQVYGCKYYKVKFDEKTKRLNFWLIFENQTEFNNFKKYLSRDIQVFDNNYSKDEWHFEFAGDGSNGDSKRRIIFNSIEIGRYKGIVNQYYLRDNVDTNESEDENDTEEALDDYYDEELIDEEYDENETSENAIYDEFDNPYIVQVAYELNRHDLDEINQRNLEDEEAIKYVYDNVLGNYYSNGFLASSAIGDFVLINRFQRAIDQLWRDECYSPNLAMWLFNVKRARTPQNSNVVIDKWLNPKIERNENQKEAIKKMIAAPDLCLIQGPPGTGKTTVIAEAIYQFVRRGDRVLVASQSNDAVDNALERLADTPEIRAIRLGQKGRRKRKSEDLNRKFVEEEALKYYYHALSLQVSKNWLDKWDALENGGLQYDTDIRDANLFNIDIAELNKELARANQEYEEARHHLETLTKELENVNTSNSKINENQHQFSLAEDCFNGNTDSQFYLSPELLKVFEKYLNDIIEKSNKAGIHITPQVLDGNVMGLGKEQAYVYMIAKNLKVLKELCEKIKKAKENNDNDDGEAIRLNRQFAEAKEHFTECTLADDINGADQYKKEMKTLLKRLDDLKFSSSVISISPIEASIIDDNIANDIESGKGAEWENKIEAISDEWVKAIDNALADVKNIIASSQLVDDIQIRNNIDISKRNIDIINEKMEDIKSQRASKSQTLLKLREKYDIESTSADDIIAYIKRLKEQNIQQLEKQRQFRNDWEKTIRGFKERLEDGEAFKYDQEYYQQTYINACNVVGISCTDNMRNLSDKGYDDFDVVIIDEVSKATPPELLIPLMKARKAILVGDHRQLPPMFKEHEESYKELIENQEDAPEEVKDLLTMDNFNNFSKMVTSSLFKDYYEQADDSIKHPLLVQYRMHTDIMDIINRFYEQRLICGNSAEIEKMEKSHNLTIKGVDGSSFVVPENHAYWIDSSVLPSDRPIYDVRPNNSTSCYNVLEKHIVIELLKKIAAEYKEQGYNKNNSITVGVISFYQMQVNEIREAFREAKKKYDFSAIEVDINTVDRFQGKEKNIIITSLVRNNVIGKSKSKHIVAFERINVAFSRAQNLLFIVGAKHMYEEQQVELPNMDKPGFKTAPVYKNIMEELNRKGCFKSCNKIITPDVEKDVIAEYKELGGRI